MWLVLLFRNSNFDEMWIQNFWSYQQLQFPYSSLFHQLHQHPYFRYFFNLLKLKARYQNFQILLKNIARMAREAIPGSFFTILLGLVIPIALATLVTFNLSNTVRNLMIYFLRLFTMFKNLQKAWQFLAGFWYVWLYPRYSTMECII